MLTNVSSTEAVGHVGLRIGIDHAVGDPAEPGTIERDNAPAGVAQAGIDAEDSNHLNHSASVASIERIRNT